MPVVSRTKMSETPYRLSISPQLEPFRSETEHACDFLDACYFLKRAPEAERVLHYGPGAPAGSIAIPAKLFPSGVRTDGEGLHPVWNALKPMAAQGGGLRPSGIALQPGSPIDYDALGLIFFMLSRVEERSHPGRDRYGRFPVEAALFAPENGRLFPYADCAVHDIAVALLGHANPPLRTHYQVAFTHDVDILKGYHRPIDPLRNAAGDLLKRMQPLTALRRLRRGYLENEPYTSMRRLMALSERHNIKSRFYFMGPSDDTMDSPYVLRWPELVRKMAGEMRARGHVLGFHPCFYTFNDPVEWKRQHDGIQAVIGEPLREGRQHVLRYDAAITPRIWSDAEMTLDCTLSYPEVAGFRTGTCRPHHAYDLVTRRRLPLMQLSTAVMEFGMFGGKYRDMSIESALSDTKWAVDLCRKYGGTFTLLFHSGQNDAVLWNWLEPAIEQAAP